MKTRSWAALLSLWAIIIIFSVGLAEAADGTLKVTFKYSEPTTGVVQNLNSGYIYLRDATKSAPMEKFFSKPDYIFGPSNFLNGEYSYKVPAGKYFIRILQRKVVAGASRPYGPPEAGDLTWFQTTPITIVAGGTLNLGMKYANPFGSTITVTGIVKNSSGMPLAGRYVRATTEPCYAGGEFEPPPNYCGPVVLIAHKPTEVDGKYTLLIRDPGTYYLSTFSSWHQGSGYGNNYGAPAVFGSGSQLITVNMGESKTADITASY